MKSSVALLLVACATQVACTQIVTSGVTNLDSTPNGIRLFGTRSYLMVGGAGPQAESTIVSLADHCRAYDVKPRTILSKQDFKLEMDGHQLKALTANQDTTAFLTFFKDAATLAAKGAGLPVSTQVVKGTFGLNPGIYQFQDNGSLVPIQAPQADLPGGC